MFKHETQVIKFLLQWYSMNARKLQWRKKNNLNLPDAVLKPVTFIPTAIKGMANNPKYKNQVCHGAEIIVTDREKYKSVKTGIEIINIIQKKYPAYFK